MQAKAPNKSAVTLGSLSDSGTQLLGGGGGGGVVVVLVARGSSIGVNRSSPFGILESGGSQHSM